MVKVTSTQPESETGLFVKGRGPANSAAPLFKSHHYNKLGRRLHMQDANTLTYFTYDAGGQLTDVHDCILDKTISYTYDKLGRRDSMTDPEGDVIYYDYDSVKLIRIKRNTDEEAYYAYDAGGRRNYTLLGNGSYTYYDYDVNGRLKRVANHKSDDSVISSFEYTLDPVGNRTSMTLASGDTVYYEYDGIYQLVQEDRRQSDDSLVYINYFEYDLAGNRTHLHYVDTSSDEWTYYTYNIENQLTIEEKGGTATYYTYDAAGSLISKKTGDDEFTYEYTYEGQMNVFSDGATNAYYTYDSDFRRVEKKVDGVKTKFEYSGSDVVAEYDNNDALAATFNTPELDQNLTIKISNAVYHYLQDGLGSVRNLIDSDETIQNTYDYLAFGAVFGSPTEDVSNPFRFTGRRWDSESSLHFYRARMMDQTLGRFISEDIIFHANLYRYAKNNPVLIKDPYGLFEDIILNCHYACCYCEDGKVKGFLCTVSFGREVNKIEDIPYVAFYTCPGTVKNVLPDAYKDKCGLITWTSYDYGPVDLDSLIREAQVRCGATVENTERQDIGACVKFTKEVKEAGEFKAEFTSDCLQCCQDFFGSIKIPDITDATLHRKAKYQVDCWDMKIPSF